MAKADKLTILTGEFEKGASLAKCRKCGCMNGALEEMETKLSSCNNKEAKDLLKKVDS
jgi:hypothetical protein